MEKKLLILKKIFSYTCFSFLDDTPNKSKKNNSYIPKHIISDNEDCKKSDCSNIVLVHEGNIKTLFQSCDLLSNQILLQSNNSSVGQSFNYDTTGMEQGIY